MADETAQFELTPQWDNYIDLDNDAIPWLGINQLSDPNQTKLQFVIDFACQWVQNYLGRPVAPTRFKRLFDGWSGFTGSMINLPYYPVIEMIEVTEWWGISGPHTLTEQVPQNQGGQYMYQMDYLHGRVIRAFTGLVQAPFFPGSRNIEIEWVAGYNPVPADLRVATLELIAHWWRNTQQSSRSWTPAGEDYDPMVDAGQMWAAVPHRITAILSPYLQVGIG